MPPRPNRRTTLAGVDNRPPSGNGVKPQGSRMSMIPRVGRENSTAPATPTTTRDNNRRKTMGVPTVSSTPSAIQPPKAQANNNRRQSIGVPPPAPSGYDRRKSIGVPPANAAAENRRQSVGIPSANVNDRRKSIAVPQNVPAENRRQSMGLPPANAAAIAKQDTRLINDKGFQRDCIQKIYQFLVHNGYLHPISQKTLSRPSGRDFSLIVSFMLRKVDPCFQTGNIKFEDEVAMQFKALGYPFPVSKTALVAAGSPHTWPALLAALVWLVDFLNSYKVDNEQGDDEDQAIESIEELEPRSDQLFFKYLGSSYIAFMKNDIQASEQLETELAERFESDDVLIDREAERVTDLNARICEAIDILSNEENDIPVLEAKREKYAGDLEQLHELIAQMDERKISYEARIANRRTELEETNRTLNTLNDRITELNEKVATQKLSVDGAERIEEERKGLEEAIERKMKLKSQLGQKLSIIDEKLEGISEQLKSESSKYNAIVSELSKLSLVKEKDIDMQVSINNAPANDASPSTILGKDLQVIVQTILLKCRSEYTELADSAQLNYRGALDKMKEIEEVLSQAISKLHSLQIELTELEDTMALEQQAHKRTMAAEAKELDSVERRVAMLQDPSGIDEEYALILQRFAELKVLGQKQQEAIIIKRQTLQDEVNQACQAMSEYEAYYRQKIAELKEYANEKAANKPVLNLPCI